VWTAHILLPAARRHLPMGKLLIVAGLAIAAIGLLISLGVPFGRLPGDIVVRRGSFSFYFPIVTCIILSLLATLLLSFLRR
jgi:hypothetical protein